MSVDIERHHSTVAERDVDELAEFGYKQELKRDWGLMHNFGISFSIISVITGITTLFEYGLNTGGPGGQVAVTTGISFGLAGLISTTATVKSDYVPTAGRTIGIYAAVLISHATVNTFGVHVLRYLNNSSIALHSLGVTAIAIAVLAKAPTHQSAKFVFATFYDGTGDPGWSVRASPAYVAACGALMSQYTLTGFDASAHLSEETRNASWSAPIGVISSVGFSSLFGFFVILSFLFSIQDFDTTVTSVRFSQPVLQIFVDVFGATAPWSSCASS
ncbi:Amino-acid permease-like protein [Lachnellula willkommii]|uniref:Amino-acid permease-like protein n=1 Tax=Lachnellula willkommii TaxID=215461 RepID=A0A559MN28_9HELO|nr:Amino-acid permease-like protein [Lachnellula willkommii]